MLFFTHILSCLSVGFCFRFWKSSTSIKSLNNSYNKITSKNNVCLSNLGEIISQSITRSISTILNIGGFIVIFSVIISILKHYNFMFFLNPVLNIFNIPSDLVESFLLGTIEITNGILGISSIPIKKVSISIILTAFLLGCGGFSILLQVWSIISKTDLSIKPYVIGKFLHGCFASLYTFIFILILPIFQFDL